MMPFHYIYFQFPWLTPCGSKDSGVLSPADGPLIVLKQTCRHWESRGSCSEALGRQPEWKGRVPGDQRRINSTVQLRVTPLCVYCSVPPNTGQDPLIPPYLLSLISVSAFGFPTKRSLPLSECSCLDLQELVVWVLKNSRFLSLVLCYAISLKTALRSESII